MIKLIDILNELTFDQHYPDRKKIRVDNIRKVIVPKEALGNFTLSEIQEPLINAIKSKLSLKLSTLRLLLVTNVFSLSISIGFLNIDK
jgi:hypothetical protein